MKFDRRVQIRLLLKGGGEGSGTGYLVAPRLVLTADHVLDDLDRDAGPYAVTVCQPDSDEQKYPATVVWQRQDETADAALVEIAADCGWPVPESLSDLTARPPQRYGHLIGTRPHRISLTGFPAMQQDREWGDLDEHLPGKITPGTGSLAGRYEITSKQAIPPNPPDNDGTRWSGISGAAVLADDKYSGDLLCGIIRRDRRADGGTRLTATPVSHLLADEDDQPSEFRQLVLRHTGWDPVLEPIEPAPLLKPAAVDRNLGSPAALLRADTAAVAFHGRDRELADLRAWCTEGPAKIAIRVITGPGGQGKTRLARHLTDALRKEGWVTGHLRADLTDRPNQYAPVPDLTALNTALPLLLVVDYAETRPYLLRALATQLFDSPYRVRLLLLARSDGEWRTDALSATAPVRDLLATAPLVPLGPLQPAEQPPQVRHEAFRDAARDLALLLPGASSVPGHDWTALARTISPADDLAHSRYGNALTLQMTALVALLQHGPRPVAAGTGEPAEKTLLRHEERFWKDSADADAFELGLDMPALRAAVAVAALCGADSTGSAAQVLATLPVVPAHKIARTAAWLAQLYPADHDRYWGSLQPDRLAEHHASSVLLRGDLALPALLGAADSEQQAQTVTVLARAAIAYHSADRTTDSRGVLRALNNALDTVPLTRKALRSTVSALPFPASAVIDLALSMANTLVQVDRHAATEDPAGYELELAGSLSSQASWMSAANRPGEAIAALEESVEILRRQAAANPVYEAHLASSLGALSVWLSNVGRDDEAWAATEEAAENWRRRTAANPGFEYALAVSLFGLGLFLSKAGRYRAAVDVAEEAVKIRRRLAADDPAAHEPDLANSLSMLGDALHMMGRYRDAVDMAEEAVKIRRRLAADDPAAHEPGLALSLSMLFRALWKMGRGRQAIIVAEEAVKIRRKLAADDPAAHELDLANSLSTLGNALRQVIRYSEALAAEQEAEEIRRRLDNERAAIFEPLVGAQLAMQARALTNAGHLWEALQAAIGAANHLRPHLAAGSHLLPLFHEALSIQAKTLDALGRPGEAEAVRRWLAENPLPPGFPPLAS
ncbi:tetratricopeptide repeat protein [Streptomyces durhamensis]|uniref:tetratricopeptide repeat protein n=1 Tax=Streptomyces durhamensis TaxID=68194 RepID=UPI0004CDBBAD|nr:tetratricopeptide repeat protein [Streptomyces durhamensis]